MWRHSNMRAGYISTVVTMVNIYANKTRAIRKKLGLESDGVGLQHGWAAHAPLLVGLT